MWSEAAIGFPDGEVVDAGVAFLHEAIFVKFPVLISVSAVPLTAGVAIFVFEADGNTVVSESPELFFQFVAKFFLPFAGEKFHDLLTAVEEFGAIAPFGIDRVSQGYSFGVLCVPSIFRHLYFLDSRFAGKRRQGMFLFHEVKLACPVYRRMV